MWLTQKFDRHISFQNRIKRNIFRSLVTQHTFFIRDVYRLQQIWCQISEGWMRVVDIHEYSSFTGKKTMENTISRIVCHNFQHMSRKKTFSLADHKINKSEKGNIFAFLYIWKWSNEKSEILYDYSNNSYELRSCVHVNSYTTKQIYMVFKQKWAKIHYYLKYVITTLSIWQII